MITWPGGYAMMLADRRFWKAYFSEVDRHREAHLQSSGGISIPRAVMNDYGELVPV